MKLLHRVRAYDEYFVMKKDAIIVWVLLAIQKMHRGDEDDCIWCPWRYS
jgi:hypothetical protein